MGSVKTNRSLTPIAFILSPLLAFGMTALLVALEHATHLPANDATGQFFVVLSMLPVVAMTIFGGRWCGILTLLISGLSAIYCFAVPQMSWKPHEYLYWVQAIAKLSIAALLVFGVDALRRNQALLRQAHERADREALLNRIGQALRSSADPDHIQHEAMTALGQALGADRCYFALVDERENTARVGNDWRRPDLPSLAGTYRLREFKSGLAEMFERRESIAMRDVRDRPFQEKTTKAMLRAGQVSGIAVPLEDDGGLSAVLVVSMAETPRTWTTVQIELVEAVAAQVRSAVENARLRERDHKIATALQEALQPYQPPPVTGLDLASHYRAALSEANIGGDFSDVFAIDDEVTCIAIGDLSGKGLGAAAQIALVRNMLRYSIYRSKDLAQAVTELNETMIEHSLLSGFATMFVGLYDHGVSTFTYVSCGHEPALLRRALTGDIDELTASGPAIGVVSGALYQAHAVALLPGDRVLLYTDGVTEAGRTATGFLGIGGLTDMFRAQPDAADAAASMKSLVEAIDRHAQESLRDDICLLMVRVGDVEVPVASSRPHRITLQAHDAHNDVHLASFYREVLLAVTGGRLTLCEVEELRGVVDGEPHYCKKLNNYNDVTDLRRELMDLVKSPALREMRLGDICLCVTEAAANAVKHAGGGTAEVWFGACDLHVLISDFGNGISSEDLARATLQAGFSTAGSLGMGFTMMMETADSIALSTSPNGTHVMLHIGSRPRLSIADKLQGLESNLVFRQGDAPTPAVGEKAAD